MANHKTQKTCCGPCGLLQNWLGPAMEAWNEWNLEGKYKWAWIFGCYWNAYGFLNENVSVFHEVEQNVLKTLEGICFVKVWKRLWVGLGAETVRELAELPQEDAHTREEMSCCLSVYHALHKKSSRDFRCSCKASGCVSTRWLSCSFICSCRFM